jgi:two-component system NarL family sensor kinase
MQSQAAPPSPAEGRSFNLGRPLAPEQARLLAWSLWLIALVLLVAAEVFALLTIFKDARQWDDLFWLFPGLAFGFACLGALILSRYPDHALGWLLWGVGVLFLVSIATNEYAVYGLVADPQGVPFPSAAAAVSWIGGTAFFLMLGLLFLLFPDGRPPSARWNICLYLALVGIVIATFGEFFHPRQLPQPLDDFGNPSGIESLEPVTSVAYALGLPLVALSGLLGATSLVLRFRDADGIEREQLKWIAFSSVLFVTGWLLLVIGDAAGVVSEPVWLGLMLMLLATIPLSAAIAILRYRLYDIDWIINRTLVYVPLTAILAGIYIALTGVFRTLLTNTTGSASDFSIAIATVIVVAMLTPVKNYLQERVDKRFKEPHEPAKELRRLSGQARSVVEVMDSSQFVRRFLESSTQALDAKGAILRVDRGGTPLVYIHGDWQAATALSLPLSHEDTRVGLLAVCERNNGRPYTAEERGALAESAAVVGHLLYLGSGRNDSSASSVHVRAVDS